MNHELVAFTRGHDHDLEQVRSTVWAEDKPAVGFLSGVFNGERMIDSVEDVLVGYAVLARRRVNLHAEIVLRKPPVGKTVSRKLSRTEQF